MFKSKSDSQNKFYDKTAKPKHTYRVEILEYMNSGLDPRAVWKLFKVISDEDLIQRYLSNPGFVRIFKCGRYPKIIASNFGEEDFYEAMNGYQST